MVFFVVVLLKVVEAAVANECKDVLTREMQGISVDFKFLEEYNQLAEKTEIKWTSLDGNSKKKYYICRVSSALGVQ